ncbi:MAG: 50S ribosomal protein L35ae [Candidatus Pacearchaeota archaeon]
MVEVKIIQFRRGRHKQKPRHFILSIEGINDRKNAENFVGKEVFWTSSSGNKIKGRIVSPHGNKGKLRAIFEKGLPGQAINNKINFLGEK